MNTKKLCDELERVARWFDGDSTECMNGAPIVRAAIEKLKTVQQEPLTDKQIMEIAPVRMTESVRAFVRAVENAHGIYPF